MIICTQANLKLTAEINPVFTPYNVLKLTAEINPVYCTGRPQIRMFSWCTILRSLDYRESLQHIFNICQTSLFLMHVFSHIVPILLLYCCCSFRNIRLQYVQQIFFLHFLWYTKILLELFLKSKTLFWSYTTRNKVNFEFYTIILLLTAITK